MPAAIEVWLEEGTNLIISKVEGCMSMQDFARLTELTARCVERLPPNSPVLILGDGRKMLETSHRVKRASLDLFRSQRIDRLAFYGAGSIRGAMLGLFLSITLGRNRIRYFGTEQEARAWLLS